MLSLGIAYSTAGALVVPVGDITISLSGLAVGSIVGILLNMVLPGHDDIPGEEPQALSEYDELDHLPLEGSYEALANAKR